VIVEAHPIAPSRKLGAVKEVRRLEHRFENELDARDERIGGPVDHRRSYKKSVVLLDLGIFEGPTVQTMANLADESPAPPR